MKRSFLLGFYVNLLSALEILSMFWNSNVEFENKSPYEYEVQGDTKVSERWVWHLNQ